MPGLEALNAGGNAAVTSISCPSTGNCAAGGYFTDSNGHQQAFVITEKNGTWGKAGRVAGKLNTGGHAQVNALSCASEGNCVAVGQYFRYVAPNVSTQAFEVTEKNGTWSLAAEVPGTGKPQRRRPRHRHLGVVRPVRQPASTARSAGATRTSTATRRPSSTC